MEKALDPAATVYEGFWTDWSKQNRAWGLTLTLSPNNAVLVTSALAVFVTLAGSQLWSITRFIIHQAGAKSQAASPATPKHKKEQVILRNSTTDLATARLMAYLAWNTRRRTGSLSVRAAWIALVALLHAILFVVAGTFSSNAISVGSPEKGALVLSESKTCGTWNESYLDIASLGNNPDSAETLGLSVEFAMKEKSNIQLSLEYATKCYLDEEANQYMASFCNTMKRPRLQWTTTENGSCPVQSDLCHKDSRVVVLDTGSIDSHDDLGINAKKSDRLKYRRITKCSVLDSTRHVTGWNGVIVGDSQGSLPNETARTAFANYGSSLYAGTNWTYSYSNFVQFYDGFSAQSSVPYTLDAEIAWAPAAEQFSNSDFEPIPEIAQDEADLTLFFMSYSGTYTDQIDDPWFAAHDPQSFDGSPDLLETRFGRDAAISTIACTEKHQFCTNQGICTPLAGFDQVQNDPTFIAARNDHQNATFDRLLRAATVGSMRKVVLGLSTSTAPLRASNRMAVGRTVVSLPLPTNQWELELEYWHSIAMAQLQRTVVQYATGQIAAQPQYLIAPEDEQDKWFCKNLLIPSTVYQSFSVMSMILIVLFGTLIIVVSVNIEALARFFRKLIRKTETTADWEADNMLRLRTDMRESLWPPTLPSPLPPSPPPKDGLHPRDRRPTPSQRSPEIKTTVRAVEGSPEVDNGWKRSSSPTLPLEDRHLSSRGSPYNPQDSQYLMAPAPVYRDDRDSWMAISLSDLQTTAPTSHTQNEHCTGQDMMHHDAQPSRLMQRLRSPMQFHLPRQQGSWV